MHNIYVAIIIQLVLCAFQLLEQIIQTVLNLIVLNIRVIGFVKSKHILIQVVRRKGKERSR